MAQTTYPTGPVPATVARWARMARVWVPSHIVGTRALNSYALTVSGLSATIGRGTTGVGEAWVAGFMHSHDAADWTAAVPANGDPTNARVDRIVLRWDPAREDVQIVRLQGTPAAAPAAPALTQVDGGVWDLPLWRFTVPANNGAPLTGLTDDRSFRDPTTGTGAILTSVLATTATTTNVTGSPVEIGLAVTGLTPGYWEVDFVGNASISATTTSASFRFAVADGLTFANYDGTSTAASGHIALMTPGTSGIAYATANVAATGVYLTSTSQTLSASTSAAPFVVRMTLRVLTAGSLSVRLAGSGSTATVFSGARLSARQIAS